MKFKSALIITLLSLLFLLSSCGSSPEGKAFRYDIAQGIDNLDPQFATDSTARMIIGNLYEGLVVQDPDGEIHPGAAEHWQVSADGLRYTFTLREDVCWSDGEPLTAEDFQYAFYRLFDSSYASPFAADFSCVDNATQVLRGECSVDALGVVALDSRTVEFRLSYPSPFLLELLASTPAMPCSKEFYTASRGRYGLERSFVYGNGPFTLERWDNEKSLLLRKSNHYISDLPVVAGSVTVYIARENPVSLFLDNKSDFIAMPYSQLVEMRSQPETTVQYEKTTWCIVFNQNDKVLGNPLIRQGMAHTIERDLLSAQISPNYSVTSSLVPPAMMLLEHSYREFAGELNLLPLDTLRGEYLHELGLESLEMDSLPALTLLVPETESHSLYMGQLQQSWQKYLGAYINIETLPVDQLESRFRTGNYQMALMPFSPATGRVSSLLDAFTSTSTQNHTGYRNPRYDALLLDANSKETLQNIADKYKQAESMLLSDAVILPVYFETTTYVMGKGVEGIQVFPYSGRLHFKYGQKT